MADWIKVRTNLWDDPRVTAICDALDRSEAEIIGGLIKLWSMADSHTEDGTLPSITPKAIDRKIGIPGFADAVAGVGWLEVEACGVSIPRFGEHNGKTAKKRAEAAKRMSSLRGRCAESEQKANNCEQKRTNGAPNTSTSTRDVPNGTSMSQPETATSRKRQFSEWDRRFAEQMYGDILRAVPSAKPPAFESWANDLRLMREVDSRAEADIAALWEFASRDDFWSANILSPRKLREKWTQLSAKRAATQRGSPSRPAADKFQGNREFLERVKNASGPIQSANGTTHGGNGEKFLG